MSQHSWQPGIFDAMLRLVADNTVANMMIADPQLDWIFHPYDGGADVILPSEDRRDSLKSQFRNWLSARSDGL